MPQNKNKNTGLNPNSQRLSFLLITAIVLALLTIVISSYIRLAESGAGCEPWPECYGVYKTDINAQGVNVLKQQSSKAAFRAERVFHRLVASSLGILVLVIFFLSWRPGYSHKIGKLIPGLLLLLTLLLAVIGTIHPVNPMPIITFTNFSGGLLIMSLLYYLYLKVTRDELQIETVNHSGLIRLGIVVLILQILWGGWTSANFAGATCEKLLNCDFTQMNNASISDVIDPGGHLLLDQNSKVVIEPKMYIIQFIHHLLAILSLGVFVIVTFLLHKNSTSDTKKLRHSCLFVMSLLLLQFIIGLSTLVFGLALQLIALHNLLAALLLLLITQLYMKLTTRNNL